MFVELASTPEQVEQIVEVLSVGFLLKAQAEAKSESTSTSKQTVTVTPSLSVVSNFVTPEPVTVSRKVGDVSSQISAISIPKIAAPKMMKNKGADYAMPMLLVGGLAIMVIRGRH